MKSKKEFKFLVLLLVATLFAPTANALPTNGALSGWEPNSILFNYTYDGRTFTGQVDYAVYDNYPGNAPSGGEYIYAYQIINSAFSNVGVDSFSVGILEGAGVGNISSDDYQVADGIEPFLEYFSPGPQAAQSAIYLFLPGLNGLVESSRHSFNLLFSSDNAPTEGFGLIEGGSLGGTIKDLPTPMPEPATIFLLGIGGALMAVLRKRRFV